MLNGIEKHCGGSGGKLDWGMVGKGAGIEGFLLHNGSFSHSRRSSIMPFNHVKAINGATIGALPMD